MSVNLVTIREIAGHTPRIRPTGLVSGSVDSYLVDDQTVTLPVEIRSARCFVAGYTCDAQVAAQQIAQRGGTALAPLTLRPGRALVMLVFVEYLDGDLGPYHEFGVCFLVRDPAAPSSSPLATIASLVRGDAHALIHHLPVDGEFTLAAGRTIWGFPKTMASFAVDHDSAAKHGTVATPDGELIADLTIARGIPMPDTSSSAVLQSYSQLDGITRRTPWRLGSTTGVRTRLGGARLQLGTGPIADDLRALKLSRRALTTSSVADLTMTFDAATPLPPTTIC